MSYERNIKSKLEFYQKLNMEIESALKKITELIDQYYGKTKRRILIPVNMDLYAEYLVMQKLLELNLMAIHNKEDKWPSDVNRGVVDICIVSGKKKELIEVKYSKYWETKRPEYRWQFQNIDPTKFDLLVLVAGAQNTYKFFIFTKKEADKCIPPFDWAWRPDNDSKYANRWIGIYENSNDWKEHMRRWKPKKPNPKHAKENYMLSENAYVGYISTHINCFENKWDKILKKIRDCELLKK